MPTCHKIIFYMKILMKPLIYTFSAVFLLLSACTKKNTNAKEKRIKNGPTLDLGAGLAEIVMTRNDTASVALFPRAQYFFIDLGLEGSEQNIQLIKEANRLNIPVRAKVFKDNVSEIAEIYPATKEEIEKHKKSKVKTGL